MDCPLSADEFYYRTNTDPLLRNNILNKNQFIKENDGIGEEISKCMCKYFLEYYADEIDDYILDKCEEYLATEEPETEPPVSVTVITLTVLYSLVFALAILGNITVIFVVICNKSFRGNATSLIFSLAIADLLITTFCMPFNLIMIRSKSYGRIWTIDDIWCKVVPFMQLLAVVGNIFTLVAMALERYFVILYPLKTKYLQTNTVTLIILSCIWLPSILFAVPCAVWYDTSGIFDFIKHPIFKRCRLDDNVPNMKTYRTVIYVLLFIIPMLLCSIVYTIIGRQLWIRNKIGLQISHYEQIRLKSTRRVIMMLIIVQVLFAINWAPTMTFEVWVAWNPGDFRGTDDNLTTRYYLQWLAMCNSCLNPIVYTFMHEKFRKSVFCQDKRRKIKIGVAPRPPKVAVLSGNSLSVSSNAKKTNTCTNTTDTKNKSNVNEHANQDMK